SFSTKGQNSLSVSVPMIYSNVTVKNNWSPPTAYNRQNEFNGTSLGYGLNVQYSFKPPPFLTINKHFSLNIGVGYYRQVFNVERPLDYISPLFIVFYTKNYSYDCIHGLVGISYNQPIGKSYSLRGSLTYNLLNSFRQEYSVTYTSPPEITHNSINRYGNFITCSLGGDKKINKRFSIALNILVPVFTRWRNDKIFGDDPSTFCSPSFSLGGSVNVIYRFKNKTSTNL
ncbi:MAG: hypothetical protein JST69_13920, partial [Bacteroidetes bacterium]|nr:hypothetical protein [Bacteroidota bacterium]